MNHRPRSVVVALTTICAMTLVACGNDDKETAAPDPSPSPPMAQEVVEEPEPTEPDPTDAAFATISSNALAPCGDLIGTEHGVAHVPSKTFTPWPESAFAESWDGWVSEEVENFQIDGRKNPKYAVALAQGTEQADTAGSSDRHTTVVTIGDFTDPAAPDWRTVTLDGTFEFAQWHSCIAGHALLDNTDTGSLSLLNLQTGKIDTTFSGLDSDTVESVTGEGLVLRRTPTDQYMTAVHAVDPVSGKTQWKVDAFPSQAPNAFNVLIGGPSIPFVLGTLGTNDAVQVRNSSTGKVVAEFQKDFDARFDDSAVYDPITSRAWYVTGTRVRSFDMTTGKEIPVSWGKLEEEIRLAWAFDGRLGVAEQQEYSSDRGDAPVDGETGKFIDADAGGVWPAAGVNGRDALVGGENWYAHNLHDDGGTVVIGDFRAEQLELDGSNSYDLIDPSEEVIY